jgi:hypothetical protein
MPTARPTPDPSTNQSSVPRRLTRELYERPWAAGLSSLREAAVRSMAALGRVATGPVVIALLVLPACGSVSGPIGGTTCYPPPLRLSSTQVMAGATVVVSSRAFQCGATYPPGKEYRLVLGLVGRAGPMDLGAYPVSTNGTFTATARIPATAPPGTAYVIARGSPFDRCGQTQGGAQCADYAVQLTILPSERAGGPRIITG